MDKLNYTFPFNTNIAIPSAYSDALSYYEDIALLRQLLKNTVDGINRFIDEESSDIQGVKDLIKQNIDTLGIDITNNRKLSPEGNFTGSWWGIEKPVQVQGGIDAIVEQNVSDIQSINANIEDMNKHTDEVNINLGKYIFLAQDVGGLNEDWTPAINRGIEDFANTHGEIYIPSNIVVKSTINLPSGVNLKCASLPNAQIFPSADFIGDYVIQVDDITSHVKISELYINFQNNANVRGIYFYQPYDYIELNRVVGNRCGKAMFVLGNLQNNSQTLVMKNCIAYSIDNLVEPLMLGYRLQESWIENCKFLGTTNVNVNLVEIDCCTGTTFFHNSFAFTKQLGLNIKASIGYRLSGNYICDNIFEGCNGQYSWSIVGSSDTVNYEGQFNTVQFNRYLNSNIGGYVDNLVGTQIYDLAPITHGAKSRRGYNYNPYNYSDAKNVNGNIQIYFDGSMMKFDGYPSSKEFRLYNKDRSDYWRVFWNSSAGSDLGIVFQDSAGVDVFYINKGGDIEMGSTQKGKGLMLRSPNGTRYRISVSDTGQVVATQA